MIVADCSIIAPLFIETTETVQARAVFAHDPDWVMPALWRSELRSVARKYILFRALPVELAIRELMHAEKVFAESDRAVACADVLRIVLRSRCSAYDAEYLALAEGLGLPLVTEDRRLTELFPGLAVTPERYLGLSDD